MGIKENQDKLSHFLICSVLFVSKGNLFDVYSYIPLYWLQKLHNRPYKARIIANSSSCTTTILSKLLTLCLTTVKKQKKNIELNTRYDNVNESDEINYFWSIKNSNEVVNKSKSKKIKANKCIGYSLDIMRQIAYLVVYPVIVDGDASLFNCTTAVLASDSMTASS